MARNRNGAVDLDFIDNYVAAYSSTADVSASSAPMLAPSAQFTRSDAVAVNTSSGVTVPVGDVVEISGVSTQSVTFTGTTGTLKLDESLSFAGQVSGLAGSDALDLADVKYGVNTTATFLGTTSDGTLTVTDGSHTANIALVGNFLSSGWTLSSDGNGGTIVVDPISPNNWQTLDIGAGGWLTGIDIAPDDTMVVRTDTYGAYIWNGTEWQQLVTATSMPAAFVKIQGSQGVYEIQLAPSNPNIMYMMYEGYVFKSTNKGTTWTETSFAPVTENPNDPYRMDGQKMAVDPNNPNVVYVGTPQNGLFVTTDGGATWHSVSAVPASQSTNGLFPGITGIEFDPTSGVTGGNTNTIFASSYGNGVYESTNGGTSWSKLNGGPSNVQYATVSTAGVYYAVANGNTQLWSYENGAWTELFSSPGGNEIQTVAADPFNPNEIIVTTPGGNLNESLDGGVTWSGWNWENKFSANDIPWLANTGAGMSIGGLVFDQLVPNKLWASAGVGVWDTSVPQKLLFNTPVVWNSQSIGIEQLVANEIIVPPGGNPVLASWDRAFIDVTNPNMFPSTYGPVDGKFAAGWSIDYASSDPSFLVGIADWWGNEESGYSTNGGESWTAFPTFIPGAGTNFIGGTIAASSPTNIIWAPADGEDPYYTLNGGETWNPITLPGISSWTNFDFAYYLDTRTVTADRVLPNTFYLYYGGVGVFESTNGGVTWTEVHTGSVSGGDTFNTEIQSVPGEAGNLFFTAGPQNGPQPDSLGFFLSTNQGATWTAVANVLDVSCFGFGAPAPGQSYPSIYIVGYVNKVYGIWQSTNDAQSWTQIGTYPVGTLAEIKTISGDPNIYGQVYVGFAGAGYAYLTANPDVTGVTASPLSGVEVPGNTVTLTLNMSEAVTVTGMPTLTLNDGGTASFTGGSSSNALNFSYTVSSADSAVSALAVTQVNLLNGAKIVDANGNIADLTGASTTFANLQIDPLTAAPMVSSVIVTGTGITNGSGDLNAAHIVTLTVNFSDAVTVAGGTPTLTLNDGGTARYTGGSGSNALTFSYTVAPGQNTPDLAVTAVNLGAATVTDAAANAANLTAAVTNPAGTLQVNTTVPGAPTISSFSPDSGVVGDGITNATTLILTGTAVANSTVEVFDGSMQLGTAAANSSGAWNYTTGTLGNGNHSFTAKATDAAGNVSTASTAIAVTVDTVAPAVTGGLVSDTGSSSTDMVTSNPALNGSGDANAVVTLKQGTTVLGTTMANASGAWTFAPTGLAQGSQTIVASETDAAGNTGTASLTFTLDTVAPGAPTISSFSPDSGVVGDGITNATTLILTGTAAANSTVEVFDGSTQLGTAAANAAGAWNYTTGTLGSGNHSFTAKAMDAAGNVSTASTAQAVTVDTVAPGAPFIVTDTSNGNKTVTLAGTAEANSKVTVYDGQMALGTAMANATGTWSYTTGTLAIGPQVFTATATDAAGNTSAASNAIDPIISQPTAPTVKTVTAAPTNGDVESGGSITVTVTMSEIVDVTGTPALSLNDGGTANYISGSGTATLVFRYAVAPQQSTTALQLMGTVSGGSITDVAGNTAVIAPTSLGLQVNTDQWKQGVSASWNTAADWNSPAGVPASFDLVALNALGTYQVLTGSSKTIAELNTVGTATLAIGGGTFTITNGTGTGVQAGTISVGYGAALEITGTFDNSGTISLNGTGDLEIAGDLTLSGTGNVKLSNGTNNAIVTNGAAAILTNLGNTISGAGAIGDSHLTLCNQGNIIANGFAALVINTGRNTITNSGTLEATTLSGGLDIESNVSNSKTIEALGTNAKVVIESVITNATTGLILASGSGAQVDLDGATISGGTLQTSGNNATIETVSGTTNVLNGVTVSAGSTVAVNSNATLTLDGTDINSGILLVNGGALNIDGVVTGGMTQIGGTGKVTIAEASGESIAFLANSTGQLVLDQATSFTGGISGFGANTSQSIDLTSFDFAAGAEIFSYAPNNGGNTSGVLTVMDGTSTAHIQLDGAYTLANFNIGTDGNGGTLITDPKVVTQKPGNAPAIIASGTVLEINTPDQGSVTFAGSTGSLWLDQPSAFAGTVSGFKGQDVIDLPGIAFDAQTTLGYLPSSKQTGGTLSVTDGTHSASIALLGSYMASSFATASDNHGGTMVVSEVSPIGNQAMLSSPQHT